jgi:Sulfotransferase family
LSIYRFGKASGIARSVKALLNPEGSNRWRALPDVERHENRTENSKHAQRHKSEYRKKVKKRDPLPERIDTAHLRQLPDFVIIGTQRGGTTSLYRYLTQHPDIGSALRKEVHFFDRYYEKGMNWYLANFPMHGEVP